MTDEQIGRKAAAVFTPPRTKAAGVKAFTDDQCAAAFGEALTDPTARCGGP